MSKKLLFRWNKPSPWSIATGLGDGSVVLFVPGANEKTQEEWDKIKNHPEVVARMESKEIVDPKRGKIKMLELLTKPELKEVEPQKDEKKSEDSSGSEGQDKPEGSDDQGLSSLGAKEAKELILETFNTPLLRSWLESETRSTVKSAIEKQLEAIDEERSGGDSQE